MALQPLSGCRITCSGNIGLRCTVSHMASNRGATYSITLDERCTHLIATDLNADVRFAQRHLPLVHIVHPHWISRCYTDLQYVPEAEYGLSYYVTAQRTGTNTHLASAQTFFLELGKFHDVEDHMDELERSGAWNGRYAPGGQWEWAAGQWEWTRRTGAYLGLLLNGLGNSDIRHHPVWCHARDTLLDTACWGHLIRRRNWMARKHFMMALYKARKVTRAARLLRCASDGPAHALLAVKALPEELWRPIVAFI